jgi:hypothetical protein
MRSSIIVLIVILLAALTGSAGAVSTLYWLTDEYSEFLSGTPTGVSLLEVGRAVLGSAVEKLETPDAQYVWGAVRGRDGATYVVTGTPGRLYRIDRGDFELLLEMETQDLPVIATGPDGTIYVGTSPGGEIYRVCAGEEPELLCDTGEGYVWSMVWSKEHGLLVGTGEAAKVIAVDSEGRMEVIHESTDLNIVVLAVIGDRVLAGTGGDGLLLDVTPGRKVSVVYDTPYDEISGAVSSSDGTLYFAATSVNMECVLDEFADPQPPIGDGSVYRVSEGGAIEIWRSEVAPVVSLAAGPNGSIWAGTGAGGRVFSVRPSEAGLVVDLDEEEILAMLPGPEGLIFATGSPGSVYEVSAGRSESGRYESEVLDATTSASWGRCSVRAEERGGRLNVSSRSGNVEEPDDTWSTWSDLVDGSIASPRARFLQWAVEFDRGRGSGPVMHAVEIAFLRENVAPEVVRVEVHPAGEGFSGCRNSAGSVSQTLASGVEITYSLSVSEHSALGAPPVARGLRTVEWIASDMNGDILSFDVYVKGEGDGEWGLMEEELERTLHTWDSVSMPDGDYRIKVVATDAAGNRADLAASAEAISPVFTVDNTPPRVDGIELERDGTVVLVTASVRDAASPVAGVEVSIDYGEWMPAFPVDGMFDSRSEEATLRFEDPAPGEHAVAVRGADRAGNIGVARIVVK